MIATKVIPLAHPRRKPKSGTDWRDLSMMLLTFPKLKSDAGPLRDRLETTVSQGADPSILATWRQLLAEEVLPEDEDDDF